MGSDSISIDSLPVNSKDLGRKKTRTNRLAKLKQSKLDARREQWLSQVKIKGCKVDSNGSTGSSPISPVTAGEGTRSLSDISESRSKGADIEGPTIHDSDSDSFTSNSPVYCQNNLTKDLLGPSFSLSSSSNGSSSRCCSDDDCADDWEAIADALTADEKQQMPNTELTTEPKTDTQCLNKGMTCGAQENCRAWRHDDAFRPQSLPHLLKNKKNRGAVWAWESITGRPSLCPICYEDLDLTDSSFLPCPCGFHLCLFCHKRILEADGRCPGCRKQYDLVRLNSSFSSRPFEMSTRS